MKNLIHTDEEWPELVCDETAKSFQEFWYLHNQIAAAEKRVRFWRGAFAVLALMVIFIAAWLWLGGAE